ncbi:hypothetical protein [Methylobacterium hispanicum]|uniref:hypothetical protein n=1 Tax=Methylobacterium hispanicum TaxID=270350 RepID=UPI002F2DE82A
MPTRHPIPLPIDGYVHVEATRLRDAFGHELARLGRHWGLTRMRADGHRPTGYVVRSATGTLLGVVIRCVPMWRPPGGPGDILTSRHWIVLPARGPVPRLATRVSHQAIAHCAFLYAQAPLLAAKAQARKNRLKALREAPLDPFDHEAFGRLTLAST